jgi:hypothetical protein
MGILLAVQGAAQSWCRSGAAAAERRELEKIGEECGASDPWPWRSRPAPGAERMSVAEAFCRDCRRMPTPHARMVCISVLARYAGTTVYLPCGSKAQRR